ncbi:MAG: hypothetical protein JJE03_06305 [Peptostreptococcaceae bacterium]|nr:hypothetical protein [Peptostreptococcaceae bacterium]
MSLQELLDNYFDLERIHGYCTECPNYGKLWSCPPFPFDVTVAFKGRTEIKVNAWVLDLKILSDEQAAVLNLNTIYEMNYLILEEEQKTPSSFAFYADSCVICGADSCSRLLDKPCRHIDQMRYTLEAFGIDVTKMIYEKLDIELKWSEGKKKHPEQLVRVNALIK